MTRRVALVLTFAAWAGVAAAQTAAPAPVSFVPFDGLAADLKEVQATLLPDRRAEMASLLTEHTQELALYSLGALVYASLVEEGRLDKQVGTSSAAGGSTGLVSRGSVPSLIGIAVENGALYQSVSGSLVTFRLNPMGLARALAQSWYWTSGPASDATAFENGIIKLSASASFDLEQGSSPGSFTGEGSQLKEAAFRFDAINHRDPRDLKHAPAIRMLSNGMEGQVEAVTSYFTRLNNTPAYKTWRDTTADALSRVNVKDDAALKAALTKAGNGFAEIVTSDPELQRLSRAIVDQMRSYRKVRDDVFDSIAHSSALTFEYAFNRLTPPPAAIANFPPGTVLPGLSTGRVIYASPLGTAGEATLNASVTFFNNANLPGMDGTFRDVQVAGSLDLRLPRLQNIGSPVLTFAGLSAFLNQQPFGVKVTLLGQETADGFINVFQTKLTIPTGGNGVLIPLSLTFSNRSEFDTDSDVRGAIGITFDMDKLFAR